MAEGFTGGNGAVPVRPRAVLRAMDPGSGPVDSGSRAGPGRGRHGGAGEPRVVGDEGGAYSVAAVELGEQTADVGLDAPSLRYRARPISLFAMPSATRASTSFSRKVRPPMSSRARSTRSVSISATRSSRRLATSGPRAAPPVVTTRTAATMSCGLPLLRRQPSTPARSNWSTCRPSSDVARTTTAVVGARRRRVRTTRACWAPAIMPSISSTLGW